MIAALEGKYLWPKPGRDVTKFVEHCPTCESAKGTSNNIGLYSPLPIPQNIWEDLSMDFNLGLPKTPRHMDFSYGDGRHVLKNGSFHSMQKRQDANLVAQLFLRDVIILHRVPKSIVSNRDMKLTSHFWKELWKRFDTHLNSVLLVTHRQMDKPRP